MQMKESLAASISKIRCGEDLNLANTTTTLRTPKFLGLKAAAATAAAAEAMTGVITATATTKTKATLTVAATTTTTTTATKGSSCRKDSDRRD